MTIMTHSNRTLVKVVLLGALFIALGVYFASSRTSAPQEQSSVEGTGMETPTPHAGVTASVDARNDAIDEKQHPEPDRASAGGQVGPHDAPKVLDGKARQFVRTCLREDWGAAEGAWAKRCADPGSGANGERTLTDAIDD